MKKALVILVLAVFAIAGCEQKVIEQTTPFTGIADEVEQVRNTVVHVLKEGECQGSGCIISSDGFIFTAKHVTDGDSGSYVVTLDDGTEYPVVKALEVKDHDVAILKIEPKEPLPFCRLANVKDMRPGDLLFIMGSPLGTMNFNSVTLGIISCLERDMDKWLPRYKYGWTPTFQSDAAAYPGNSGGPVFNLQGEVVGVLVAGFDASLNYSVPVSIFKDDLDTIRLWFELSRFQVLEEEPLDPSWSMSEDEYYEFIGR